MTGNGRELLQLLRWLPNYYFEHPPAHDPACRAGALVRLKTTDVNTIVQAIFCMVCPPPDERAVRQ
jgi:hypothetical protein